MASLGRVTIGVRGLMMMRPKWNVLIHQNVPYNGVDARSKAHEVGTVHPCVIPTSAEVIGDFMNTMYLASGIETMDIVVFLLVFCISLPLLLHRITHAVIGKPVAMTT
jgi:hypothetical protein